jgi:hypothetical protein
MSAFKALADFAPNLQMERRLGRARAQLHARQRFQVLNCSFAQLFTGRSFQAATPQRARMEEGDCVSGVGEAQNSESERNCSRKRNEGFRDAGRKALISLECEIKDFAGLFVLKDLAAFSLRAVAACLRSRPKASPAEQHGAPPGSRVSRPRLRRPRTRLNARNGSDIGCRLRPLILSSYQKFRN